MHPKEARKQKTGTGRLTALSIEDSELIIGIDFSDNQRVNSLIENSRYFPVVLYPGEDVLYPDSSNLISAAGSKTLMFFIIDATWDLAGKMMHVSRNLQSLPKVSFNKEYKSRFLIKRQPEEHCLSTVESVYYLLEELKESGVVMNTLDVSNLLFLFQKMINYQIYRCVHRMKNKKRLSIEGR